MKNLEILCAKKQCELAGKFMIVALANNFEEEKDPRHFLICEWSFILTMR